MAVDASWPIPETANSAAGTGCRLSHGGVWCGDCRRARNGRYALSADHGTQYASTHGSMGRAAIDRLCTPQEGAAGTYTPIGRAPGRYSQNRRVICEAASNTSRKKRSARSRSYVSTSLRGALATKQSILRLLHSRRHGLLRCARNDVVRLFENRIREICGTRARHTQLVVPASEPGPITTNAGCCDARRRKATSTASHELPGVAMSANAHAGLPARRPGRR
jgi:hypothetical protein